MDLVCFTQGALNSVDSTLIDGTLMAKVNGLVLFRVTTVRFTDAGICVSSLHFISTSAVISCHKF